jgi:putative peptidoglycan lipid II flippase
MTSTNALTNRQIARAALVVLLGFLASGVLGLVRTAVISATFGTTNASDAFNTAQRIPEALYVLVAGGALGSSFIPVFSRFLAQNDEEGAWRLASAVMTLVFWITAAMAVLVALFAPQIVDSFLARGKPPEVQALTTTLTQIMMLTTVIFSVSGLLMGILNAHQVFTLPALALSMNNIGLIFGALVLAHVLPPAAGEKANIYGLAVGAILGAALHLAIQLPGLPRVKARLRFLPDWHVSGVREVLVLMGPRVLGLGIVQINFLVNAALSNSMVAGSYTALTTAWTLMFFVLGVIAQSIGTAVFPSLSALAAANDMPGFKEALAGAMRSVLFLALPATVGLIVLGRPIIGLIFERGEWTPESTAATAWALAFFAIGICGHSLLEVLSRAFYALSDTRTPVAVGVASMAANIILSLILIQFVGDPNSLSHGPFAGLALANSSTTLLEGITLWILLRRRIGDMNNRYILDGVWRAGAAALGMGIVVWLVASGLTNSSHLITSLAGAGLGAAVFFGLALLLGIGEARTLPGMILRRFRKKPI